MHICRWVTTREMQDSAYIVCLRLQPTAHMLLSCSQSGAGQCLHGQRRGQAPSGPKQRCGGWCQPAASVSPSPGSAPPLACALPMPCGSPCNRSGPSEEPNVMLWTDGMMHVLGLSGWCDARLRFFGVRLGLFSRHDCQYRHCFFASFCIAACVLWRALLYRPYKGAAGSI